jgi:hypothetical protein
LGVKEKTEKLKQDPSLDSNGHQKRNNGSK